ncbi:hypothetical protein SAMN05878426_101327 [Phaeovulum vinaykumarii]|uniref:Uncharacterized protein n=1 Tax=Phaeovulum vinaykumarii TaxID=407234 RepID=A0A1N7JTX4_9RHOB|nr:hypothetical protein SAMN05421795_101327 [Phaeovulum vinaykumarii]SOB91342.1 hypothetical protein SAMN05878426_101327 [Phaeovulum vinaykumarii]
MRLAHVCPFGGMARHGAAGAESGALPGRSGDVPAATGA